MTAGDERLIAIDWGTSNFRAFLVDRASGECLETRRSDAGLRSLSSAEFPHYCAAQVGAWREGAGAGSVPIYLAGMVGSKRGWSEAPQLDLPVSAEDLAADVVAAPGLDNAWIVPGVKVVRDDHVDVMRGEEIQAFGALALCETDTALCCLPGTHSKWARLEGGRVIDFITAMTGELYHAVRFHTLPGEPARESAEFDAGAFDQGLTAAAHPAGLLHALFEARSRHLYAGLPAERVGSFLSGVMIGSEVRTQRRIHPTAGEVLLVGSTTLNALYRRALEACDFTVREIDSDAATLAGLCALADRHKV
ncbi:2-dehydro-3-deoxygalactonokinase [Halomonas coralii]|uniref:2-dehydro-3-deoxygalactonokinase n=1 Tax=Modicisalibacter sp. R2A 31.J TaxID=2831898 RepID=UPI001CCB3E56|nr:2-dehydro-3-deoxygalactonokinase [Modicisalibacter sp. R2A 31.J]MBZ9557572.1 2-dehydro-3-deoxygalactonokinase [Modicisalibacter sp. R2A 31.J]